MKKNIFYTLIVIIAIICIAVVSQNYNKKEQLIVSNPRVYNSPESVVIQTLKANYESIGDFDLKKMFDDGYYAKYIVVPKNGSDEAQVYLKKSKENGWQIIAGPATSFPDLEKTYPELKGR
jgi:hypothetical protein